MEDESERDGGDQRARDHPHFLGVPAQAAGSFLSAASDQEHRQCCSGGVRERQQDRAQSDGVVGRDNGDRREHRACARHEDEPERRAEEEPAADAGRAEAREERERPLDQLPHAWNQECRGQHEEEDDRRVSQEVVGEPELVEEPRGEQREDGEAGDEPGDDAERLASRRPRGEQDRQHRQHARRHRGDNPREKADGEQNQHPLVDPVCR